MLYHFASLLHFLSYSSLERTKVWRTKNRLWILVLSLESVSLDMGFNLSKSSVSSFKRNDKRMDVKVNNTSVRIRNKALKYITHSSKYAINKS